MYIAYKFPFSYRLTEEKTKFELTIPDLIGLRNNTNNFSIPVAYFMLQQDMPITALLTRGFLLVLFVYSIVPFSMMYFKHTYKHLTKHHPELFI